MAIHGEQQALGIEIVLHEIAVWEFTAHIFPTGREHLDDLVRVDETAPTGTNNFLIVFRQRFECEDLVGRTERDEHTASGRSGDAHDEIAQFSRGWIRNTGPHYHLFQPQPFRRRDEPAHNVTQLVGFEIKRRPDV